MLSVICQLALSNHMRPIRTQGAFIQLHWFIPIIHSSFLQAAPHNHVSGINQWVAQRSKLLVVFILLEYTVCICN